MSLKVGQIVKVRRHKAFDGKKWEYEYFEAKVIGFVENYAAVRRPRAAPFLESIKNLEKWLEE